ncbi:MAG: hypothetical protein ABR505_06545, partial [Actinomycetota bacterium]
MTFLSSRRNFLIGGLAAGITAAAARLPAWARRRDGAFFVERFWSRDRRGWGWPWFNQRYGRNWTIEGGRGIYRLPATANDSYYRPNPILVLDRDVAQIDLRATISTNNASARAGLIARASSYADYYAAYITAHALRVVRCGPLDETVLAKSELFLESDKRYRLRLQVKGRGPVTIRAKAWRLSESEPKEWMVEYVDANPDAGLLEAGPFGIYFAHALDGRSATLRVKEVRAWSGDRPRLTRPSLAFSLAGAP